jgi:type I restriction enzyme S subunit
MSNNNENKLIPRLRFPEFQHSGEWEVKKLGEVLVEPKKKPVEDPTKYELLSVRLHSLGVVNTGKRPTKTEKGRPYYIRNINEILIGRQNFHNGSIGIVKKENDGGVCSNAISSFVVENEYLLFVFYYVARKSYYSIANDLIGGTGQKEISHKELLNFKILVPSLPEQQKIASCLSSLDEVIAGERQRLALLQQHKKGLLQQLFPQEGETVPTLRFKEFEDSGEWEVKKLGEVGEIITGNTPPTNDTSNYGGDRLFVSPTDISEDRYVCKTKTTLSEKGFSKTRQIKENSVLVVCIGSTIGKVAQNKYLCATNQQINSIITYENYSSDFLYSSLQNLGTKIKEIAGRQAVPIIKKSLFSDISLRFPSLPEQQKIASCLSSLDDTINAQTQKIELLERHKKGLLQGLFSMENG